MRNMRSEYRSMAISLTTLLAASLVIAGVDFITSFADALWWEYTLVPKAIVISAIFVNAVKYE